MVVVDPPSGGGSTYLEEDLSSAVSSVASQDDERDADADESSFRSSLPSDEESVFSDDNLEEYSVGSSVVPQTSSRGRRTRIAFFVSVLVTLVCVPLALVFTFVPLKDATESSGVYIGSARGIVEEVRSAISSIESTTNSSIGIMESTTFDFGTLCPLVAGPDAESTLGVDLNSMTQFFVTDYIEVEAAVTQNITEVDRILNHIEDAINFFENSYDEAESYMWAVPGVLLGLSFLTLVTMAAVVMAWKRESSRRFQRFVSYGILPFFVAFSIVCWFIAISAAITTAMISDACSPMSGSPEDTIRAILQAQDLSPNSTVFEFVSAYSGGCTGEDPTRVLVDLKLQLQTIVDTVWRSLSAVDSAGRSDVIEMCGGTELEGFLTSAKELARLLTSVRKQIDSATLSLDCERINPLYLDAVHDSMCTDVAGASAWGFVLFFVLGLSTMSMITLRASWRHKIGEDKIYDESEVADNMIMGEHEEYLNYISKYKHEWQEYKGIDPSLRDQERPQENLENIFHETQSESDGSTGSRTSESGDEERGDADARAQPFDPYTSSDTDNLSTSTGRSDDISFLSLHDTPPKGGVMLAVPPPLLDSDDFEDGFQLPPRPAMALGYSNPDELRIVYAEAVPLDGGPAAFDFEATNDSIEIDSPIIGSLGTAVTLSRPPTRQLSIDASPSAVQFVLPEDDEPASHVQRQVENFTHVKITLPSTPTRSQPAQMKALAAKFDSPFHGPDTY